EKDQIREDILRDSIISSVIQHDRLTDLQEATNIVDEAVQKTLTEVPLPIETFNASLEANLRSLGIQRDVADAAVKAAVFIPKPSIAAVPPTAAPVPTPVAPPPVTPTRVAPVTVVAPTPVTVAPITPTPIPIPTPTPTPVALAVAPTPV